MKPIIAKLNLLGRADGSIEHDGRAESPPRDGCLYQGKTQRGSGI
jgi:hypothetical protein